MKGINKLTMSNLATNFKLKKQNRYIEALYFLFYVNFRSKKITTAFSPFKNGVQKNAVYLNITISNLP